MPKDRREGQDKTAVTILPAPPSPNPGVLIGRFRGRFVLIYRFGPARPGPAQPPAALSLPVSPPSRGQRGLRRPAEACWRRAGLGPGLVAALDPELSETFK